MDKGKAEYQTPDIELHIPWGASLRARAVRYKSSPRRTFLLAAGFPLPSLARYPHLKWTTLTIGYLLTGYWAVGYSLNIRDFLFEKL